MNIRIKYLIALTLFLFALACQGQTTISLNGKVSLDFGIASKNYDVDVTVSNHSFIVISVFPFIVIRPRLSYVTQSVTIQPGDSSVDYLINGISTDAVDYVIDFRCDDCTGVFTPQYYTNNGNSFSMNNSVYIDPDNLPNNLNFTLTSGAAISGVVSLPNGKLAKRNLNFLLSVIDSTNSANIFRRISVVIPKGTNSTTYSIDKLIRETGLVGFNLQLDCLNCLASSVLTINYSNTLDASIDSADIDFEVIFNDLFFSSPINYLLLGGEE